MAKIDPELFPLSTSRQVKGNRRLAREKVLQILIAYEVSGMPKNELFSHIFFREFNFGEDGNEPHPEKLLTQDEITDIESDTPIRWKQDDIEFGRSLLDHAIQDKENIDNLIKKFTENWEFERIALTDRLIMRLATVEFEYFSLIPTKVSINEALDIAKKYSTDKSSNFINGVLDSILIYLQKEGKVRKYGKGKQNHKN